MTENLTHVSCDIHNQLFSFITFSQITPQGFSTKPGLFFDKSLKGKIGTKMSNEFCNAHLQNHP